MIAAACYHVFFCQPNKKPIQPTWAKSGSKANRPIPLEPEVLADLIKVPLNYTLKIGPKRWDPPPKKMAKNGVPIFFGRK